MKTASIYTELKISSKTHNPWCQNSTITSALIFSTIKVFFMAIYRSGKMRLFILMRLCKNRRKIIGGIIMFELLLWHVYIILRKRLMIALLLLIWRVRNLLRTFCDRVVFRLRVRAITRLKIFNPISVTIYFYLALRPLDKDVHKFAGKLLF